MKKLTQTKLHNPPLMNGNCWATCIACILELPEIPEIDVMEPDFWEQSQKVVNQHGYTLLEFEHKDPSSIACWPASTLCILSGPSPRSADPANPVFHAVVGRLVASKDRIEYCLEHDPHPSGEGITDVKWYTLFAKL